MRGQIQTLVALLIVGWLALGCSPTAPAISLAPPTTQAPSTTQMQPPTQSQPPTVVVSPPSGSEYHVGEDVAVQSTWNEPNGVARVELAVDGTVVRTDTPPQPQPSFTVVQMWKATAGSHILTVRAFNQANQAYGSTTIAITVAPALTTAPPTETPLATATALPAPAPSLTPGAVCANNAAFVADVTVPDGTVLAQNQAFNKIWRMRNTGTCEWGEGFAFAFVSGDRMGATTPIGVPKTAPGATADLLVPMTAPATPGPAEGFWRLRSPGETPFGVTVFVKINVASPAPAPAPTLEPTQTPTAALGCSGTPVIESFTASATTINPGQSTTLSWGLVGNAQSAVIDNGIGGVTTPGSITVSPSSTTTYTLTADCGGDTATAQVTIDVVPAGGATATSTPVAPTITMTPTRTRAPTETPTPTRTPRR